MLCPTFRKVYSDFWFLITSLRSFFNSPVRGRLPCLPGFQLQRNDTLLSAQCLPGMFFLAKRSRRWAISPTGPHRKLEGNLQEPLKKPKPKTMAFCRSLKSIHGSYLIWSWEVGTSIPKSSPQLHTSSAQRPFPLISIRHVPHGRHLNLYFSLALGLPSLQWSQQPTTWRKMCKASKVSFSNSGAHKKISKMMLNFRARLLDLLEHKFLCCIHLFKRWGRKKQPGESWRHVSSFSKESGPQVQWWIIIVPMKNGHTMAGSSTISAQALRPGAVGSTSSSRSLLFSNQTMEWG